MTLLSGFMPVLPLPGFLPGTIDFLVGAILEVTDIRLLAGALRSGGLLLFGQLGAQPLKLGTQLIGLRLQAVPLLGEIGPKGVAVLQLRIQGSAGVFGQILGRQAGR